MKKIYIIMIAGLSFLASSGQTVQPQVIASSGDYFGCASASLSWTLGEPVTETFSNGGILLTQGFQQPVAIPSAGISLHLLAFLEGPYEAGEMNNALNMSGVIPLSQPYNTAPWNYSGVESVAAVPNGNVIDWVLVELRDAPDAVSAGSAAIVARQAAFILNNGHITGSDGASDLTFSSSIQHALFVVVWHRNHLGIMSSVPVVPAGGIYSYDFTTGPAKVHGGINAHKQVAPGVWGMTGGDGNADGQINNGDKNDVWALQAGTGGYKPGDFNLDAQVNNSDKNDVWKPNSGLGGQVPDGAGASALLPEEGYKCFVPE
ncbi:MAG: hypothetical protein JXA03_08905 [Bacteroidales bacterium]|nr:hypothetical protein [Bacteroidales bacterium]